MTFAGIAMASSQGMYIIEPISGQLMLTNWTSNERTAIGDGIASFGWTVPTDCTPTAVDTTGKWLYTFARRHNILESLESTPWSVISIELRDGTIRKVYELPDAFPPTLSACEHTLAEDGEWHAYVSAITHDVEPRLVMNRFTYTWPTSNESVLLVNKTLTSLTTGSGPALSSAVTNVTAWVALSNGLIGFDLVLLAPIRALPIKDGSILVGLQYSTFGVPRTFAVLVDLAAKNQTSIANFVDTGTGIPILDAIATSQPVVPDYTSHVALISDRNAFAIVSAGDIVTLGLSQGAVIGRIPACDRGICPAAIAYEPFVFLK
jgi:hypothetical protein